MKRLLICLLLVLQSESFARENQHRIHLIENGYTFSYSFESTLPKDSLLSVLFNFQHLVRYSSQISDISVISSELNSYVVSFSINYLFYSSKSVYRRTLLENRNTVLIEMIRFSHNSSIIPKVISSKVEYRVIQKGNKTLLFYNQECRFDKQINWFYLKILEGKLIDSSKELQRYIHTIN